MADNQNLKTGFVRHNGARLYAESLGAGPAVVLLHAGVTDLSMWDGQMTPLTGAGFSVTRCDLRGHGQSKADDSPFSHPDDLLAILDARDIERAALVGCSEGGDAALEFALAHPDRVWALVLVSAAPPEQRTGEITKPTLVIVGDEDDPAALTAADLLAKEMQAAHKEVITGAGRLPNLDQPERFNHLVTEFLTSA